MNPLENQSIPLALRMAAADAALAYANARCLARIALRNSPQAELTHELYKDREYKLQAMEDACLALVNHVAPLS